MKVATVIGARPQFIKAAAVSRVVEERDGIDEIIIHTGQHFDENMSKIFFNELELKRPHYNLGIGGGFHGAMTGQQLEAIEKVFLIEKPDAVLVYGDTNSTLAGTLAAVKLHIPVAHVEAGLRSFNRKMPEEINRVLVDHAADILFAPTATAMKNLAHEGLKDSAILVGDVMYDTALFYEKLADEKSNVIARFGLQGKEYVLLTIHRAENTDDTDRLREIIALVLELAQEHQVVFPVHPRTRKVLEKINVIKGLENRLKIVEPVGYLDIIKLEKQSMLIMTDSGGMQKEAYFHKIPCVTIREETEWVELIENGFNRLIDLKTGFGQIDEWLSTFDSLDWEMNLYGDGKTAESVLSIIIDSEKNV